MIECAWYTACNIAHNKLYSPDFITELMKNIISIIFRIASGKYKPSVFTVTFWSRFLITGGLVTIFVSFFFLMAGNVSPVHSASSSTINNQTPISHANVTAKSIVIIIPGFGSNLTPDDYSYIIKNLSDKGYTVEKYYPNFTDISNYQNLILHWSQGVGDLAGTHKVIVIGHSVGGTVAIHFCATDNRCLASIDLDGGPQVYEKIPVPNLYLQGEVGNYCDQGCKDGRTLAEKITTDSNGKQVFLTGLKHMNFTDLALHPPFQLWLQGYFGSINAQTGLDEIDNYIDSFLSNL